MKKTIKIGLEVGIHCRPARDLITIARKYENCNFLYFNLTNGKNCDDGKSIMNLMGMGTNKNDIIEIEVVGDQEKKAIQEITDYLKGDKYWICST